MQREGDSFRTAARGWEKAASKFELFPSQKKTSKPAGVGVAIEDDRFEDRVY